jgi:hypothetical protein
MTLQAELRHTFSDADAFNEAAYERGWSDGLPVVAPTEQRVQAFLETAGLDATEVLGRVPTREVTLTAEVAAANAVMAGCRPEDFPVVVAAVRAHLSELGNSHCTTASLGGPSHAVVVNGPVRTELGIAGGQACMGPGFRANATIGRALRLVIRNACRSVPGALDRAVFSTPARYSFCFGEDEEAGAPWQPMHVQLGYQPEQSTVTMLSVWGILESNGLARDPEPLLDRLVEDLRYTGFWKNLGDSGQDEFLGDHFGFLAAVGAEHRQLLHAAGWSKDDVQRYVFDGLMAPTRGPRDLQCVLSAPERILLVAAGGTGIPETQVLMPHLAAPVTELVRRP